MENNYLGKIFYNNPDPDEEEGDDDGGKGGEPDSGETDDSKPVQKDYL